MAKNDPLFDDVEKNSVGWADECEFKLWNDDDYDDMSLSYDFEFVKPNDEVDNEDCD